MIKKLFLLDDRLESRIKFWTLIGPIFLILTTLISSNLLSLIIILSIFFCYRLKKTGLYFSSVILISYSIYNHFYLSQNHLIDLAKEVSAFLGFFITSFSFQEITGFFSGFEDDKLIEINELKEKLQKSNSNLENQRFSIQDNLEKTNSDIEKKDLEIKALADEKKSLEETLKDLIARKDFILNELDSKEKIIEEKNIKLDELFEKISFLKDEEFLKEENIKLQNDLEKLKSENLNLIEKTEFNKIDQNIKKELENKINNLSNNNIDLKKEIEDLKSDNVNLQEKTKDLNDRLLNKIDQNIKIELENKIDSLLAENSRLKEIDVSKETNQAYNQINCLYKQLKDQFEEKQKVLHKTRRDLFVAQEELSAFLKEKDSDYIDLTNMEKQLVKDLENASEEISSLLFENEKLKDIITLLNIKKTEKKTKKLKPEQELLF